MTIRKSFRKLQKEEGRIFEKKIIFFEKIQKKFSKKIFSKLQKRSKMLEKMILSPMEVVSEGGNREKVAKKEKLKKILGFQRP